jgi:peptide deformylase
VLHEVLTFGNDALRRRARPVAAVDEDIRRLARDLLETMYAARGVGLAAEQIGRDEAVCVIDVPREAERPECVEANAGIAMPLVMINPRIVSQEGQQRSDEGCLSFPDISVPITRAAKVAAVFLTLEGGERTIVAQGLLARAVQHELDHLEGTLLVDRMSAMQRLAVGGQLRRLRQSAQAAG